MLPQLYRLAKRVSPEALDAVRDHDHQRALRADARNDAERPRRGGKAAPKSKGRSIDPRRLEVALARALATALPSVLRAAFQQASTEPTQRADARGQAPTWRRRADDKRTDGRA
jgi:hypothetical protein